MPRLTHPDYLNTHHWLASLWEDNRGHFSLLSYTEQRRLHDYFVPNWSWISDEDLVRFRSKLSSQQPSLPAAAGRAAARLRSKVEGLPPRPTADKALGPRRVIVKAVARAEIDLDAMARALLRAADDLKESESDQRAA